jgi:hypothetical protein
MGVDYDGVGGVGFYVDDYIDKFTQNPEFRELWEAEDYDTALEKLCVVRSESTYELYGNAFNGNTGWCITISCSDLEELLVKVPKFIAHFNTEWALDLTYKDIKIITEGLIW